MSFNEVLGMGEFRLNTEIDSEKIVEVRSTRGTFAALEGTDSVGKFIQIKLITDQVKTRGWEAVTTREPGGTNLGRQLRELLLEAGEAAVCEGQIAPRAEALLFAADRAQHVTELVAPALDVGRIIIDDRFVVSSVAYQEQDRDLEPKEIRDSSLWATGGLTPNLTVLLDSGPKIAWEHQQDDETWVPPDRMEGEGLEFQRKVRARFRYLVEGNET